MQIHKTLWYLIYLKKYVGFENTCLYIQFVGKYRFFFHFDLNRNIQTAIPMNIVTETGSNIYHQREIYKMLSVTDLA